MTPSLLKTRLEIEPLPPSKLRPISALFNPDTYRIGKSVTWSAAGSRVEGGTRSRRELNAPILNFGGGSSRQLTLDLFFDITDPVLGNLRLDDVRHLTNRIVELTRIERLEKRRRPPTCRVSWGDAPAGSDFPFVGVVSDLTQSFTMFRSDGKPARAHISLVFLEVNDPEIDQRTQRRSAVESATRVTRQGDTLSGIAAEANRDPKAWRTIAEANNIDDPRRLMPGRTLTIPKPR
jgi:LysM repeat protein